MSDIEVLKAAAASGKYAQWFEAKLLRVGSTYSICIRGTVTSFARSTDELQIYGIKTLQEAQQKFNNAVRTYRNQIAARDQA